MCSVITKKLTVRLFRGFAARYGEASLTFGRGANSKSGQLFQILMTRPGEDFSKEAVVRQIYDSREVADPNASFRNAMLRLRRYLEASPLPPGNYLELKNGRIRFAGPVEVESDAWELEQTARQFCEETDTERKIKLCERALELYQGEFLPQLSGEHWVMQRNRYYQNQYFAMLRYLLAQLKERGDHVSVGRLALRAMELEPLGEWLSWRIDSLMAQGRRQDAVMAYQAALKRLEDMGDAAPGELYWQLSEIGRRLSKAAVRPKRMIRPQQEWTGPLGGSGSLPGFVEQYQLLKQAEKCRAIPFVLLLCTIQDEDGCPMGAGRNHETQGKRLIRAFRRNLRAGDFYEKFNRNQYLLLCVGVEV